MCAGKFGRYCAALKVDSDEVVSCLLDAGTDDKAMQTNPSYKGRRTAKLQGSALQQVQSLVVPKELCCASVLCA